MKRKLILPVRIIFFYLPFLFIKINFHKCREGKGWPRKSIKNPVLLIQCVFAVEHAGVRPWGSGSSGSDLSMLPSCPAPPPAWAWAGYIQGEWQLVQHAGPGWSTETHLFYHALLNRASQRLLFYILKVLATPSGVHQQHFLTAFACIRSLWHNVASSSTSNLPIVTLAVVICDRWLQLAASPAVGRCFYQ